MKQKAQRLATVRRQHSLSAWEEYRVIGLHFTADETDE
jgi:hypothetical protein